MDLLEAKASNGTPTFAWWANKIEWSLRCHDYEEEFGEDYDFELVHQSRMSFRNRFGARAGLVNQVLAEFCRIIDLDPQFFKCCETPEIICIDGIVISVEMQRITAQRLSQPWLLGPGKAKRATNRSQRHIWQGDKSQRESMLLYAGTGVKSDEYQNLLRVTDSTPSLRNVLIEFSIFDGSVYSCPRELHFFFRSLGKDVMPATQLLPANTWPSVKLFLEGGDHSDFGTLLSTYAPVMSHLYYFGLAFLNHPDKYHAIRDIFKTILVTAMNSYPELEHEAVVSLNETIQYRDAYDECLKTGVYFPNWRYHSGIYHVPMSAEKSCMKYAKKNGRLGSGCLLYWCAKHRVCLGWEMLLEGESPKQVYHTLCSRFPVMPKVIIYDNGCNLFEYFYNRCPRIGLKSLFLSDGFHFSHHINCSHSFDCKKYTRLLSGISSVTHEQKNSILAKLKLTAPGMRYDTFVLMMSCVLAKMNYKEKGWSNDSID